MARVVQRFNQTGVDPTAIDHRDDMANSLLGDCDHVRIRFPAPVSQTDTDPRRVAVSDQLGGQFGFRADSIRNPQFTTCGARQLGCVGFDPMDDLRDLALLQMDRLVTVAVFGLGIDGNRFATEHHLEQLAVILDQRWLADFRVNL